MDDWKAIGYIGLGFGSILLVYALFAYSTMLTIVPAPSNFAAVALAANAPWFVLAALMYVVLVCLVSSAIR